MDDHGDANLESTLRGPRLTKRKFKTVGVVLGDGSTWQIGGPPLGGQAAIEYFTAVEKMDNAIMESDAPGTAGALAGAQVQQAAYETACVILRQTYRSCTRQAMVKRDRPTLMRRRATARPLVSASRGAWQTLTSTETRQR